MLRALIPKFKCFKRPWLAQLFALTQDNQRSEKCNNFNSYYACIGCSVPFKKCTEGIESPPEIVPEPNWFLYVTVSSFC